MTPDISGLSSTQPQPLPLPHLLFGYLKAARFYPFSVFLAHVCLSLVSLQNILSSEREQVSLSGQLTRKDFLRMQDRCTPISSGGMFPASPGERN